MYRYRYCFPCQEMGRVESLYLYPVKSLAPVPVPGSACTCTVPLYQEMGRVESLYLYPVKSPAPVPVPELGVGVYM